MLQRYDTIKFPVAQPSQAHCMLHYLSIPTFHSICKNVYPQPSHSPLSIYHMPVLKHSLTFRSGLKKIILKKSDRATFVFKHQCCIWCSKLNVFVRKFA